MSNITVTVSDFEKPQMTASHDRYYFSRVSFNSLPIRPAKDPSTSPGDGGEPEDWVPDGLDSAVYFNLVSEVFESLDKPIFLTDKKWEDVKNTPSCFITGAGTMMPRIIIPDNTVASTPETIGVNVVDNGLRTEDEGTPFEQQSYAYDWIPYLVEYPVAGSTDAPVNVPLESLDAASEYYYKKYCSRNQSKPNGGVIALEPRTNTNIQSAEELLRTQLMFELPNDSVHTPMPEDPTKATVDATVGGGTKGAGFVMCIKIDDRRMANMPTSEKAKIVPKVRIDMGDGIHISVSNFGEMIVDVHGQLVPGQLAKTDASQKPINIDNQSNQDKGSKQEYLILLVYPVWNGLVIQSGVNDQQALVAPSSVFCIKDNKANIIDFTDPPMMEIDYEELNSDIEVLNSGSVETDWGDKVRITFLGSEGSFCYSPIFFVPGGKCTVYFKDKISLPDSGLNYAHYAYTLYSKLGAQGQFTVADGRKAKMIKALEGTEEGMGYYRMAFEFDYDDNIKWPRRGMEAWDYIKKTSESTVLNIRNANGPLVLDSDLNYEPEGAVSLENWKKYIKSVQIRIGMDGSSGSIVLDKYGLVGQRKEPPQSVGGITISVSGGEDILSGGQIFKGLYMGISDNSTENDDTWTINLYGLEKKLEDIKLVNVPFWDGDAVGTVTDYLEKYANVDISYNDYGDRTFKLPRSNDFANPAINYSNSTSVIEALRDLGERSNHYFCFQVDGIGHMYTIGEDGILEVAKHSTIHELHTTIAESVDKNPDFSNVTNTFLTGALLPVASMSQNTSDSTSVDGSTVFPHIEYTTDIETTPTIPWMKLRAYNLNGVLSIEEIKKQHDINVKIGKKYMSTGSISIPGNADIKLFDRVKVIAPDNTIVSDHTWYVHEISHNVDLQSKRWTTSLGVSLQQIG